MDKRTPQIIHFLWLNFNSKTNGILDDKLKFFKDRIIGVHPGWKINFVWKMKNSQTINFPRNFIKFKNIFWF